MLPLPAALVVSGGRDERSEAEREIMSFLQEVLRRIKGEYLQPLSDTTSLAVHYDFEVRPSGQGAFGHDRSFQ
jgi:hypothetical protein